jgi:hypothetical protein
MTIDETPPANGKKVAGVNSVLESDQTQSEK